MNRFAFTSSIIALAAMATPAAAQNGSAPAQARPSDAPADQTAGGATGKAADPNEIVVTATRRSQRLQDVPMSVTAFTQAELTQKGIVGFEGVARETPGVVLDARSSNNLSITTRGISTNGYQGTLMTAKSSSLFTLYVNLGCHRAPVPVDCRGVDDIVE